MANIFLTSDTHFGHAGVCKFLGADGSKMRPWTCPIEMDEAMIDRWNSVVRPRDTVYHLGDVTMTENNLATVAKLNGKKILIKGNHDIFAASSYLEYFEDIRACHVLANCILTHIPLHPSSLGRFGHNVHGHLHDRRVLLDAADPLSIDCRYFSACVEHHDYTPIALEKVRAQLIGP